MIGDSLVPGSNVQKEAADISEDTTNMHAQRFSANVMNEDEGSVVHASGISFRLSCGIIHEHVEAVTRNKGLCCGEKGGPILFDSISIRAISNRHWSAIVSYKRNYAIQNIGWVLVSAVERMYTVGGRIMHWGMLIILPISRRLSVDISIVSVHVIEPEDCTERIVEE